MTDRPIFAKNGHAAANKMPIRPFVRSVPRIPPTSDATATMTVKVAGICLHTSVVKNRPVVGTARIPQHSAHRRHSRLGDLSQRGLVRQRVWPSAFDWYAGIAWFEHDDKQYCQCTEAQDRGHNKEDRGIHAHRLPRGDHRRPEDRRRYRNTKLSETIQEPGPDTRGNWACPESALARPSRRRNRRQRRLGA